MPEMLTHDAGFEEVLWNFAHLEDNRRISLHDKPHFYAYLPASSEEYTAQFRARPMEELRMKQCHHLYSRRPAKAYIFLKLDEEHEFLITSSC